MLKPEFPGGRVLAQPEILCCIDEMRILVDQVVGEGDAGLAGLRPRPTCRPSRCCGRRGCPAVGHSCHPDKSAIAGSGSARARLYTALPRKRCFIIGTEVEAQPSSQRVDVQRRPAIHKTLFSTMPSWPRQYRPGHLVEDIAEDGCRAEHVVYANAVAAAGLRGRRRDGNNCSGSGVPAWRDCSRRT